MTLPQHHRSPDAVPASGVPVSGTVGPSPSRRVRARPELESGIPAAWQTAPEHSESAAPSAPVADPTDAHPDEGDALGASLPLCFGFGIGLVLARMLGLA